MIDIGSERLVTPSDAARLRPPGRSGRPTHVSTIYRWIRRGHRGVKLEAVRIGGCLYTSSEALQRFAERLTLDEFPSPPPSPRTTTAVVRARTERAERVLDRLGI